MDSSAFTKLGEVVGQIRDPRVTNRSDHLLVDIVGITILAVLSGADDFVAVASFAGERRDWLAGFFELLLGIPSHDTFVRVWGLLDPKAFSAALVNWTAALQTALNGRIVAIEGKTARGSASPAKGVRALHLVSAWAIEAGLTLGQVAVDAKSNEITAIPELLDIISVNGATVTIDAMGMQKAIVETIREKKADYVIGLQDNQPTLAADMHALLDEGCHTDFAGLVTDLHVTVEKARGGTEQRDVRALEIPQDSPHRQTWKDLRTLAIVLTRTERQGLETFETRLYLSSCPPAAKRLAKALRSHWALENTLHWSLDVTFGEDHHRLLDRHSVCHLSAIRRLCVSIRRRETTSKLGAKNKRFKAALNPHELLELLEKLEL